MGINETTVTGATIQSYQDAGAAVSVVRAIPILGTPVAAALDNGLKTSLVKQMGTLQAIDMNALRGASGVVQKMLEAERPTQGADAKKQSAAQDETARNKQAASAKAC